MPEIASVKSIQGGYDGSGLKIAIIASRFNQVITKQLVDGCLNKLKQYGTNLEDIQLYWVPGSLEIPLLLQKIVEDKKFDAVICLGCIIRGETFHFEIVARETAKGIMEISRQSKIPVIFGIITAETFEQAVDRAGGKLGNKGEDAASTAVEMVNLLGRVNEKKDKG